MVSFYVLWMILVCIALSFRLGHPVLSSILSFFFRSMVSFRECVYIFSLFAQMLLFLPVALLAIIALCYLLKTTEKDVVCTNFDALVDRQAVVISDISLRSPGYIKVGSEKWMARSLKEKNIPSDTLVRIVRVKGAHVIVERY